MYSNTTVIARPLRTARRLMSASVAAALLTFGAGSAQAISFSQSL